MREVNVNILAVNVALIDVTRKMVPIKKRAGVIPYIFFIQLPGF